MHNPDYDLDPITTPERCASLTRFLLGSDGRKRNTRRCVMVECDGVEVEFIFQADYSERGGRVRQSCETKGQHNVYIRHGGIVFRVCVLIRTIHTVTGEPRLTTKFPHDPEKPRVVDIDTPNGYWSWRKSPGTKCVKASKHWKAIRQVFLCKPPQDARFSMGSTDLRVFPKTNQTNP